MPVGDDIEKAARDYKRMKRRKKNGTWPKPRSRRAPIPNGRGGWRNDSGTPPRRRRTAA